MKKTFVSLVLIFQIILLVGQEEFSFAYLPDLHLRPDSSALASFEGLSKKLNSLQPDFMLTGGDMIYTAKNVNDEKASLLFNLMDEALGKLEMPIYLTMGNHELVGITAESGIDKTNPMWGKQMYEKRYTSRYYSMDYEGWKFFILDGIQILEEEKNYTQGVDSIQINWIKEELIRTPAETPVVISIHTPLINPHGMLEAESHAMSVNSEAVLTLFREHNLRMVLQGHNHIYMNLFIKGVHYISGGSTSFGTGPMDYGFIMVNVKNGTEEIEFIPASAF